MAAKSKQSSLPAKPQAPNFKKLFDLRFKNKLSFDQISDISKIPKSTLHTWFAPIEKILKGAGSLDLVDSSRASLLGALEFKILIEMMDKARLKKASINNLAYAFQQLYNARRLELGLSTGNLAINVEKDLTKAHEKAQNQRDKLRDTSTTQ